MGSSPLARGLPTRSTWDPTIRRIIPARAGFTGRRCRPRDQSRDHPRSRGVYTSWYRPGSPKEGSSPLARGLPLRITTIRPPTRIIPARAGFTVTVPPTSAQPWDHPRSRGVYLVQTVSLTVDRWIIPARAGFTPRGRVRGRGRPDHPRSRGVYPSGSYASMMRDGSSPLARGLPPTGPPGRAGRGIIPARAGFTECPAPPDLAARDHPRSRGVYTVTSSRAPRAPGSSPLARGLHGRLGRTGRGPGIIPARAGFTGLADFEVTVAGDHPRSRGVYGSPCPG